MRRINMGFALCNLCRQYGKYSEKVKKNCGTYNSVFGFIRREIHQEIIELVTILNVVLHAQRDLEYNRRTPRNDHQIAANVKLLSVEGLVLLALIAENSTAFHQ